MAGVRSLLAFWMGGAMFPATIGGSPLTSPINLCARWTVQTNLLSNYLVLENLNSSYVFSTTLWGESV